MWFSTKTYGHDAGFSCCFRQWRADSHCNQLHGYALAIKVVFKSPDLDARNWVVDFGDLKDFKKRLADLLDHTTLVAEDDPHIKWFMEGAKLGVLNVRVLPAVGCEMVAKVIEGYVQEWLHAHDRSYIQISSIEVREHEGNSAGVMV